MDRNIVDIIFLYWVKGKTMEEINELGPGYQGVSARLKNSGFSAERGRNPGKLRHLLKTHNEYQIKQIIANWLRTGSRDINDLAHRFTPSPHYSNERQGALHWVDSSNRESKAQSTPKEIKEDSGWGELVIPAIAFILIMIILNKFFPFWWWVDVIISFLGAGMVIAAVEERKTK